MSDLFHGPRLKIKRAYKHIDEIQSLLVDFAKSDFYTIRIEYDAETGANILCFDIDKSDFPLDDSALAIGDALHNLRSSLDHLWFQAVIALGGETSAWTRFPVFDEREQLENSIHSALEKKQISITLGQFMLETIKPYYAGNPTIWALHTLNIREKHEMLIPVLKLMQFSKVHLENHKQVRIGRSVYLMDESSRIALPDARNTRVEVKDKGKVAAQILFDIGTPFEGEAVIPTLRRVAEETRRTIEAFDLLLA